ncbi:MAG: ATP-binding protein [Burkholderiaceae bacterium]|nr:ATP-binding protein [Burkholderiaceae bacterium]
MNQKLLALYGLKWNPFSPDIPLEALMLTPKLANFCWRVENLVGQGGFALVTGEPGLGKSITLRLVVDKLRAQRELTVGILSRPQATLQDFYRELGDLFQVQLSPHNRWAGTRLLRERWLAHIEAALVRPILVIDEAQEMQPSILNELRLLSAANLDSSCLLTVVLGGDSRLTEKFRAPELLPLGSRIRVRLTLQPATPQELLEGLRHGLEQAGNPNLMTPELMTTLTEHAAGNYRILMTMAAELLDAGIQRNANQLDEKLYLEVFAVPATPERGRPRSAMQR